MMTLKEKITLLLPQFDFKPDSWSLTFGLPHIGLGVMSRALANDGAKLVFDTGLFNALKFPPSSDYIRFNSQKNQRHLLKLFLLHNLKHDYKNHKLVFQESLLNVDLYEVLVREWGKPISSFSLTCDYIFFKKMYFKKKPFNTESECERVYKLCTEMITKIPSKSLRIDSAVNLPEFEEFMSSRIADVDRDRDPTNLFDY